MILSVLKSKGFGRVLGLGIIGMIMLCACGSIDAGSFNEGFNYGYDTVTRAMGGY